VWRTLSLDLFKYKLEAYNYMVTGVYVVCELYVCCIYPVQEVTVKGIIARRINSSSYPCPSLPLTLTTDKHIYITYTAAQREVLTVRDGSPSDS